ncbi:isochorismatase family cysteine hydrolase [Mammaliicoccus sp. Dog046]|uniref:isochorismatase family cysteine hydrolase n=1 Tax=Mammaliicoccus sp. Dog046 TaxID=3034233 RepID=UPI002B262B41|nr:isochorismatase family cysteine hydrolase [Mammaliicoccus sp. Dog046]WQK84961.1 isochorismatase family cysteine hydrolase [Mammaliicoccus sp. Dog046]
MEQNTALLIMDMQNGIAGSYPGLDELVKTTNEAIAKAREANIPILFVRLAFSKNFSEVSPNNILFSKMKTSGIAMTTNDEAAQIVNGLDIESDDLIVTKQRISAFTGSNLDVLLSGLQVDHLVLTGIATSGVVLSTAVEAFDKDYTLTVLKDAAADRDAETHDFLVDNILTRYGDVITTEAWMK